VDARRSLTDEYVLASYQSSVSAIAADQVSGEVTAMRRRGTAPPPMPLSALDGGHVGFFVALAGGRGEVVEALDLLRA
jgi:hypothetical protein